MATAHSMERNGEAARTGSMYEHDRARGRRAVGQHDAVAPTPGKATLVARSRIPTGIPAKPAAAKPEPGHAHEHAHEHDHEPRIEQLERHPDHKPEHGAKAKDHAGGEVHIITRAGLRHLRHDGPRGRDAARILYNNPNAYIVLKDGQTLPRGWKGKATVLFPSYAEFAAAAKAGRIPKFIEAVVYDNEHWAQTPRNEKTHAIHFARAFGNLAQRLGLTYIAAPTQKWFAADARFADIIDVQLQSREVHTGSYERALRHDAKLAHRLNPDIKVVAQISSNRNHLDPDHSGNIGAGIRKAERDIVHNADYIDGFWGYLYQRNHRSIHAGQEILEDLADKREHGTKI